MSSETLEACHERVEETKGTCGSYKAPCKLDQLAQLVRTNPGCHRRERVSSQESRGAGIVRTLTSTTPLDLTLTWPSVASASLPKTRVEHGYQLGRHFIGWAGDGTGYLGGFSGDSSLERPFPPDDFGRLRWTTYNGTEGRAWGPDWLNNGNPDDAEETFTPYRVSVHLYRLRNGNFTRLAFNISRKSLVLDAEGDRCTGQSE